ncbi:hypothetical protein ACWGH8_06480 [Nonomuraea muscovyensis]|uniref:Uncharacterized protein n=1 Tax=Nonomuraea muscovyensis TaxID=1124761 RepID=A0A7X0C563_9ACTN|nr:hypothetical protein [Nonomuraea muscovyensis]MBB6347306.1 hypothetical protein [Nonomuraea muscovyensis]
MTEHGQLGDTAEASRLCTGLDQRLDGAKTDPLFVEVVGPYHDPPERAVVLCVDEKSQIQALSMTISCPAG